MPLPNTFLIGTQKSGSTSLYDWVSQHPDVCGDLGLKDISFFVKDKYYEKGLNYLSEMFLNLYDKEKIIFHASVEYIYYKKGLERLKNNFPEGKFVLILRNPVERLISSFTSCTKMKIENEKDILVASVDKRNERLHSLDYDIRSQLTYIDHGLYAKQLELFFSFFNREQLFVCFYEDMQNNPTKLIKDLYSFLNIDANFIPKFDVLNKTGIGLRSLFLQRILFRNISSQSSIRRFFINKIVNPFFPLNKRHKLKWKIKEWNSIKHKDVELKTNISHKEKKELLTYFIKDIERLEQMLKINLDHWKKVN
jgi:hypothetical protein